MASGGIGWQQWGSRVQTLPDHGRCCFAGLLGCLPLTDGLCDDVLDVVKGVASETVIELTQEEKEIIEKYGSDKNLYVSKNQKHVTRHRIIRCAKKHCWCDNNEK